MTDLLSLSNRLSMSSVSGIERIDDNLFRSTGMYRIEDGPRHGGRGTPVYGGQVAAQTLSACGMTVSGRLPHSLHGYFLRPGRTDLPMDFRVDTDRDGRSYSSRRVTVIQDDQTIFSMSASFRNDSADDNDDAAIGLQPQTGVPEPTDCQDLEVEPEIALDVRMCTKPTRAQYFPTLFWARPHQLHGGGALEHAAALVYLSDYSAGLPRNNGKWTLGPSIDHAFWLHRPFVWDDWVLVELSPGVAAQGRGWYTGTITDRRGLVIASFAQEMVYFAAR